MVLGEKEREENEACTHAHLKNVSLSFQVDKEGDRKFKPVLLPLYTTMHSSKMMSQCLDGDLRSPTEIRQRSAAAGDPPTVFSNMVQCGL